MEILEGKPTVTYVDYIFCESRNILCYETWSTGSKLKDNMPVSVD